MRSVVKMMADTDDMCEAMLSLVRALFETKGIDSRTREMIILRAAKVLNAPYEWWANAKIAANTGLSPEEINAATDRPVSGIAPDYVLVCRAADELSTAGTLRDET